MYKDDKAINVIRKYADKSMQGQVYLGSDHKLIAVEKRAIYSNVDLTEDIFSTFWNTSIVTEGMGGRNFDQFDYKLAVFTDTWHGAVKLVSALVLEIQSQLTL